MQQELGLLTQLVTGTPSADAQAWQSQMLLLFQLLLPATGEAAATPFSCLCPYANIVPMSTHAVALKHVGI